MITIVRNNDTTIYINKKCRYKKLLKKTLLRDDRVISF